MATRPPIHRPAHVGMRAPDTRPCAAARGYDARWRKVRLEYLRANPLCVHCLDRGTTKPATDVDHITPVSQGGSFDGPLQSLCHECHASKTQRERVR
jgi:5-methylcytosine-specific restriction protein A